VADVVIPDLEMTGVAAEGMASVAAPDGVRQLRPLRKCQLISGARLQSVPATSRAPEIYWRKLSVVCSVVMAVVGVKVKLRAKRKARTTN
jgi:hypothetical protein